MATKRKRTAKKKNNDKKTYYASFALIIIILLIITVFQLGLVGEYTDAVFNFLFGTSRYFTYLVLLLASFYLATHLKFPFTKRMLGYLMMQFGLLFLLHSILYLSDRPRTDNYFSFNDMLVMTREPGFDFTGGGIIGQTLFNFSATGISFFGTLLIGLIFIYMSIIIVRHKSIEESLRNDFNFVIRGLTAIGAGIVSLFERLAEWFQNRPKKEKEVKKKPKSKPKQKSEPVIETPAEDTPLEKRTDKKRKARFSKKEEPETDSLLEEADEYVEPEVYDSEILMEEYKDTEAPEDTTAKDHALEIEKEVAEKKELEYDTPEDDGAVDIPEGEAADSEFEEFDDKELKQLIEYKLPSIDLLNDAEPGEKVSNKEVIQQGRILEETLKNFNVNAKVSKIRIGPAVTQFEIQPDVGVKVSKIINLQNDIALSLAAKDIRIEAPIPGKSAVGIEVPNSVVSMVT